MVDLVEVTTVGTVKIVENVLAVVTVVVLKRVKQQQRYSSEHSERKICRDSGQQLHYMLLQSKSRDKFNIKETA